MKWCHSLKAWSRVALTIPNMLSCRPRHVRKSSPVLAEDSPLRHTRCTDSAQEYQNDPLRARLRLQGLSMDVRPEVRNSAARTLFAVVAGQGGRMSAPAWEECLWQMLFPLLRSVHHLAATSSKEEVCVRAPAAPPVPPALLPASSPVQPGSRLRACKLPDHPCST